MLQPFYKNGVVYGGVNMPNNGNMTDEEYLDSLLNAVNKPASTNYEDLSMDDIDAEIERELNGELSVSSVSKPDINMAANNSVFTDFSEENDDEAIMKELGVSVNDEPKPQNKPVSKIDIVDLNRNKENKPKNNERVNNSKEIDDILADMNISESPSERLKAAKALAKQAKADEKARKKLEKLEAKEAAKKKKAAQKEVKKAPANEIKKEPAKAVQKAVKQPEVKKKAESADDILSAAFGEDILGGDIKTENIVNNTVDNDTKPETVKDTTNIPNTPNEEQAVKEQADSALEEAPLDDGFSDDLLNSINPNLSNETEQKLDFSDELSDITADTEANTVADNDGPTFVDAIAETDEKPSPNEDYYNLPEDRAALNADEDEDEDEEIPKGFFAKLKAKLFSKKSKSEKDDDFDDEESTKEEPKKKESFTGDSDLDALGLEDIFNGTSDDSSDETEVVKQDISMFESGAEATEAQPSESEDEEAEKKKDKKAKKEKKKKEKKPKEKKVKEKKPKPPKEPDEIIKIPVPALIIFISIMIFIIIGVTLGGSYYNYRTRMTKAVAYYVDDDYKSAYDELAGLTIKSDDEFFYHQIMIVMSVQSNYDTFKSMMELRQYEQALDYLLKGVDNFDLYQNDARDYESFDDMQVALDRITAALSYYFGITESEARELNLIEYKKDYSEAVYEIAANVYVPETLVFDDDLVSLVSES